jgi:hypothetical protein
MRAGQQGRPRAGCRSWQAQWRVLLPLPYAPDLQQAELSCTQLHRSGLLLSPPSNPETGLDRASKGPMRGENANDDD